MNIDYTGSIINMLLLAYLTLSHEHVYVQEITGFSGACFIFLRMLETAKVKKIEKLLDDRYLNATIMTKNIDVLYVCTSTSVCLYHR